MISKLHLITQDGLSNSHLQQAKLALEGGAKLIQFRSKTMSIDEIKSVAKDILQLTQQYNAKLILNDHWETAIELGLDGVHVGLTDTPISEIRKHTDFIIGGTANTFEDIKMHYNAGANYVGVGPFRFTKTKDNLSPILGEEGYKSILKQCEAENISIPVIGIGGINTEDVSNLLSIGLHGIAIASQINTSSNPTKSTQLFLAKLS